MTTLTAPVRATRGSYSRPEVVLGRMTGLALFLLIPTVVSALAESRSTRAFARALSAYSPERLVHGALWTLPASAFLLPRLGMIGPTTVLTAAVFMPFVLVSGLRKAARTFLIGHVVSTLAVFVVVVPAAALGWDVARHVYFSVDVGASAGLTAVAGAMCVMLARRQPLIGVAVGMMLIGFFVLWEVTHGENAGRALADVEHLLAFATGIFVERRARVNGVDSSPRTMSPCAS